MNSEQETINLRREENELNLSDLFHIVLANWYWFVLSVLVCAGVARCGNLIGCHHRYVM